jgi:hypothetical protein
MTQLLRALQQFHQKSEFNKLKEDGIYLSSSLNTIYVDPGYYTDPNAEVFTFWKPPEDEISEKSDIYIAGFIFFKLLTQLNSLEIQEIYDKKSLKAPVLRIVRKLSVYQNMNHKYHSNFQNEIFKYKVIPQRLNLK